MYRTFCASCIVLVLVGAAQGAVLELRAVESDDIAVLEMEVGETATFEIVLTLREGEPFFNTGVWLVGETEGADQAFELFDFEEAIADPSAVYARAFAEDNPFPYAEGEGITFDEYYLNLDVVLEGPREFVLDRLSLRALAPGTTAVSIDVTRTNMWYQTAPFDWSKFTLADAGAAPTRSEWLYLGVGDSREGGDGPLTITVLEAGAPPVDNGTTDNGDNGTTDNGDDGTTDTGDGGTTGFRFCGPGCLGAVLFSLLCLGLVKLRMHERS